MQNFSNQVGRNGLLKSVRAKKFKKTSTTNIIFKTV